MENTNKTGFTLVELAIVLVIIGLLIGGILVAQSMVTAAKITSQIRQIQQFDIALVNFTDKYKQLPGDSNIFATAGDNDKIIENSMAANTYPNPLLATWQEERANFWKHLSDSEVLDGKSYANTAVTAAPYLQTPDGNVPAAAADKNSVALIMYITGSSAPCSNQPRLFWIFKNKSSTGGWGAFTVEIAAAIDKKLDDGIGYGGCASRSKTIYSPLTACAGSGGPDSGPYNFSVTTKCVLAVETGLSIE